MPKKALLLAAKLAVTAVLLYFVFRNLSLAEIAERLRDFSLLPLLLAICLIAVQSIGIVAWRWGRILTAIDRPTDGKALLGPVVIAIFFNQVLPSTVGGDGMRIWLLTRMDRPLGLALRSVLLDRILGMLALMALSGLGAIVLVPFVSNHVPLWGTAAVSFAGVVAILAAPAMLHVLRFLPIAVARRQIETVANEIRMLRGNGTMLLRLLAVSAVGHLLIAFSIWALAGCLRIEVPGLATLAMLPAVFLAAALPISIAGWGIREGAMVLGFGLVGVAAEPAALISVSFGLLQLGFGMFGGLVWLIYGRPKPVARMTA